MVYHIIEYVKGKVVELKIQLFQKFSKVKMKGIFKMEQSLIVRGTPQEYLCEIGSWELLEGQLLCRNIHRVFILHGLSHGKRQNRIFRRFKSNSCF